MKVMEKKNPQRAAFHHGLVSEIFLELCLTVSTMLFLTRVRQSPLAEIRPLVMKAKRKKVSRPAPSKLTPNLATLDGFLE